MNKEQMAIEDFVVESATNGLYELFGEGYSEKFDSYKSMEPALEKTENDIMELIRTYRGLQVEVFGGGLNSDSDNSRIAERSANLATLNFISRLYSACQSEFNDSTR